MNFVANHPDAMLLAQRRHGLELLAAPDFARWVVRAAEQQQGILRLRQRRFQARHIAVPVIVRQGQWHRGDLSAVSGDSVIERIVGGSMDDDAVAFLRPLADGFRHHINNRRSVNHRLRIDDAVKAAGVPVGNRPEKRLVLPAAVAEHAVGQPPADGVEDAGRGGEIHIGDGERQQVGDAKAVCDIVPLRAPGAVAVDGYGKIKHRNFLSKGPLPCRKGTGGIRPERYSSAWPFHLLPTAPAGQSPPADYAG
ncbi:hypothetical protein SB00610_01173 [Klebsiella quasipneumoniae subsp. similipneumoniae]|nr:hypothetical protein SB00610_01173 [Klebsiella quasipneumoniae subsp. similipneumoniae]